MPVCLYQSLYLLVRCCYLGCAAGLADGFAYSALCFPLPAALPSLSAAPAAPQSLPQPRGTDTHSVYLSMLHAHTSLLYLASAAALAALAWAGYKLSGKDKNKDTTQEEEEDKQDQGYQLPKLRIRPLKPAVDLATYSYM